MENGRELRIEEKEGRYLLPEEGPQINPSRDIAIESLYESIEFISFIASVTSFQGKLILSKSGNGLGPGIESETLLQTLNQVCCQ